MEIGFKQYLVDTKLIPNDGYFCNYDYRNFIDEDEIFCTEVNIINKIKYNEDGIFDFSGAMIDIGSDIGIYSFILPFDYHYMFEGNRNKCIISEFNMLLWNKELFFECHNVLLSDKHEKIQYNGYISEYTKLYPGEKMENSYIRETNTLDEFNISKPITFIKIDVECMEYKVLKGAINTIIKNDYPPILFELWPVGENMDQKTHDQLVNFLEDDLGYEILWEWGQFDTHLAIHK